MEQWRSGFDSEIQYFTIHVHSAFDVEAVLYTLSLDKINLCGEGKTIEEAKADLVDSVKEWVGIYQENIARYEGLFDAEYKTYMRKLMIFSNGQL